MILKDAELIKDEGDQSRLPSWYDIDEKDLSFLTDNLDVKFNEIATQLNSCLMVLLDEIKKLKEGMAIVILIKG